MNYSYQGFTWKIFSNIYACMHKARLYKHKNITNSKNVINSKKRRGERRRKAGFLACWILLIENLAKTRTTRKNTFPDESALPKSGLGGSQQDREIRKAVWLHISHTAGPSKIEWFPDIGCSVPPLTGTLMM